MPKTPLLSTTTSRAITKPKHDLGAWSGKGREVLQSARMKPTRGGKRSPLGKLAIALALVLGPLAIAPFSAMAIYGALASPAEQADVIIVPGAALREGGSKLSDALRWRMDSAVKLYKEGRARYLLVSGGGEGDWNEARAMARYAIAQGVPERSVLIEDQAATTRETGRFASQMMRENKLFRALVVSQWFHVARVRIALEQSGVATSGKACTHPAFLHNEPYFVLREALALYAYGSGLDSNARLRQLGS